MLFAKIKDYFIPRYDPTDRVGTITNIDEANRIIKVMGDEFDSAQYGLIFWRTNSFILTIALIVILFV